MTAKAVADANHLNRQRPRKPSRMRRNCTNAQNSSAPRHRRKRARAIQRRAVPPRHPSHDAPHRPTHRQRRATCPRTRAREHHQCRARSVGESGNAVLARLDRAASLRTPRLVLRNGCAPQRPHPTPSAPETAQHHSDGNRKVEAPKRGSATPSVLAAAVLGPADAEWNGGKSRAVTLRRGRKRDSLPHEAQQWPDDAGHGGVAYVVCAVQRPVASLRRATATCTTRAQWASAKASGSNEGAVTAEAIRKAEINGGCPRGVEPARPPPHNSARHLHGHS
jgi:hypothetical protein